MSITLMLQECFYKMGIKYFGKYLSFQSQLMYVVPVVPAVERPPVQEPDLPVHSRQPAVCSTRPRLRCSPAVLQLQLRLLQLLWWLLLCLEQLLLLQLVGLEINIKCQIKVLNLSQKENK